MAGFLIALVLAVLIGLSLGLLGSGGAIITLPVLVYVAGIAPPAAVGMSLAIVGGTSFVGAVLQFRRGHFHGPATAMFAATGAAGAYFGATLTHLVSPRTLMLCFSALMLVVGATMTRRRAAAPQGSCFPARCLAIGVVVGTLTGFLGVGGGFLILPALVLFAGLSTKQAVGTSLAIIAFNSAAGVIGQLRHIRFDWAQTAAFLTVAVAGMFAGSTLGERLSERVLRATFGWVVMAVGAALGVANLIP